ncbi:AAA family ATPase [Pelagibacterium halotolerans]|uniref:AAA family ATPase n=1 Tax=Pelagibacterium halotolerans TaxID=531813 RepID=UPI00384D8B19
MSELLVPPADTDAAPERPHAAAVLPKLIVKTALGKDVMAQLSDPAAPAIAVLIQVPAPSWCAILEQALEQDFRHVMAESFAPESGSTRKIRDKSAILLDGLAKGSPAIAISADPDALVGESFRAAADHRITIEELDVKLVRDTIAAVTGDRARGLAQTHLVGLGLPEVMAAIRKKSSGPDCVMRIRRLQENRQAVPVDLADIPPLDTLPLTGPVRAWADDLAAEIARCDAGTIAASALRFAVLEGPPGTGKTLLASSLARTTGWRLVRTSMADWLASREGHLGDVTQACVQFFDGLLAEDRAIGFIDELQSLPDRATLSQRAREWWIPVVDGVLMQIDRVRRSGKPILLLGACNHFSLLDAALVRPGRLETRISVLPPATAEDASAVLRYYLGARLSGDAITAIAALAIGKSPAAIEAAVRSAEARARKAGRALAAGDLAAALAPDPAQDTPSLRTVALHEAGHAVVAHRLGTPVTAVSVIAEGMSAGTTQTELPEGGLAVETVETMVKIALAGRATDALLGDGPTAGAASDLATATELLVKARTRWGLYDQLAVTPQAVAMLPHDGGLPLYAWVEAQLGRLMDAVRAMVIADRHVIAALAAQLAERKVLHRQAIVEIIAAAERRGVTVSTPPDRTAPTRH